MGMSIAKQGFSPQGGLPEVSLQSTLKLVSPTALLNSEYKITLKYIIMFIFYKFSSSYQC
jgi:hypothetical protein